MHSHAVSLDCVLFFVWFFLQFHYYFYRPLLRRKYHNVPFFRFHSSLLSASDFNFHLQRPHTNLKESFDLAIIKVLRHGVTTLSPLFTATCRTAEKPSTCFLFFCFCLTVLTEAPTPSRPAGFFAFCLLASQSEAKKKNIRKSVTRAQALF